MIIQDNDDATYVSVIVIDPMQRPEKTLRFDKSNKNDLGKWIQAGLVIQIEFYYKVGSNPKVEPHSSRIRWSDYFDVGDRY